MIVTTGSSCFARRETARPPEITGTVEWVFDGDTIRVGDERVRLVGIDTPETAKPARDGRRAKKGQCFGDEATRFLIERLKGRSVRLEGEPMQSTHDKYGRRLAYVYLGDDLINRELVTKGYAEAVRYFPYDRKEEFLRLESEARAARRGRWGACGAN